MTGKVWERKSSEEVQEGRAGDLGKGSDGVYKFGKDEGRRKKKINYREGE